MKSKTKRTWRYDHNESAGTVLRSVAAALALLLLAPASGAFAQVVLPPALSCVDDATARTNGCTAKDVDIAEIGGNGKEEGA